MLQTSTRRRPNRSVRYPPSRPKIPPATAGTYSIVPTQSLTSRLFGATPSRSASAGRTMSGSINSS
jgi:hypothetical protein